ncbi:hypothetical protein AAWM_03615 [Aspergillus awamori]|uniref:Rootletin n=1 Tax=Aspergillus awamori TaxID=105351 RepID=A0A401KN77_ASPAW|nr:hypothetical protein AAWM_03615 [Aspergillus awamori]GKZ55659.1 hypothetical protein AnigIFM49718_000740 [Aspergillus niger]
MQSEQESMSEADSIVYPELTNLADGDSYDEVEELLLMHMADNNDSLLPELTAAMVSEEDRDMPRRQASPLLMERPQSPGIDMAAFCFQRPTQGPNSFSLQPAKRSSLNTMPPRSDARLAGGTDVSLVTREGPGDGSSSYPVNSNIRTRTLKMVSRIGPLEAQGPETTSLEATERRVHAGHNPHVLHSAAISVPQGGQRSSAESRPVSSGIAALDRSTTSLRHRKNTERIEATEHGNKASNTSISREPLRRPGQSRAIEQTLSVATNQTSRITKRHRSSKKSARLPSTGGSEDGEPKLSEEDLFQLLISRIRDREKGAILASKLKQQMEAKITQAAEENNILKGQLEESCQKIQKQSSQLEAYKSRMETWRSKFAKFRSFLNDFGCDFQNLRGEAIKLKGTRKELLSERNEINTSIKEAREQLAKASTDAEHRRGDLIKVESQNELLRQSLKDAGETSDQLLRQLSDEKKRSGLLEVHIQNCSRAQSTKLDKIMSHQREMIGGFDAALISLSHQHVASIKSLQEGLSCDFSGCLALLRELQGSISSGKADATACTDIIHAFAARMDSAMHQLNAGIGKGTEATAGLTENLKAQTEIIGKHIVSDTELAAKISKDSENNESLQNTLRTMAAANENITLSMKGLEARESGLLNHLTALESSLSAIKLPDQRELLKDEKRRFEQTIAEMKSKIQSLSEQSKSAEEALRTKDLENQALRGSLEIAESKANDNDCRVRRYEAEVTALKDEVKFVESRVRKELSRASVVSRERDRARYDQQLHKVLREKSEVESNLSKVSKQLAETRLDLTECEDKMKHRVNELELMLESKEKKNEALRYDISETKSKLEIEKHEAARLAEVASFSATEQASLHRQIEEAAQRISSLEDECRRISKEGLESVEDIQSKHDMLYQNLQKKEDECLLIQSQLKATMSEKADLECHKGRVAEEIKSLLRRVQESDNWMKKLKATLGQAGLVTPDQPASEAWSSLETILRTVISRDATRDSLDTSPGGKQDVSCSKARTSTPQKSLVGLGQEVYKATEVIYKAESFQASIVSSPFPAKANLTEKGPAKQPLQSAQNPNIVPFSSFHQQSPTDSSVFGNDQDDLAAMLMLSSEQRFSNEAHSTSRPDETQVARTTNFVVQETPTRTNTAHITAKGASNTVKDKLPRSKPQSMKDEKGVDTKINREGKETRSKAVTFGAQSPTSLGQKRKSSAGSNISSGNWQSQPLEEEDRPARLNRRTYARARQPVSRTLADVEEQPTRSLRNDVADRAASATTSSSYGNKRAKVSVDPPEQKPQKKPVSEYFERKPSPAKLASGSSRPSSMNASQGNIPKRAARGRGAGRKTRGDHYNARFGRGA